MAPVPRTSSPSKGKTRTYSCKTCGKRHAAPTGLNCRAAMVATHSSLRGTAAARRTVSKRTPASTRRSSTVSGRGQPFPMPAKRRPGPIPSSSQPVSSVYSGSESESLQDFLPVGVSPTSGHEGGRAIRRKRPAASGYTLPPPKRSAHHTMSPRLASPSPVRPGSSSSGSVADGGLSMVLAQLSAMQDANRREMDRIEREGRAERRQMQLEAAASAEGLRAAIADLGRRQTGGSTDVPPTKNTVASDGHAPNALSAVSQPASSANESGRRPSSPKRQDAQTGSGPSTTPVPSTSKGAPAVSTRTGTHTLSLERQPPVLDIHPEDLAADDTPIQSLRRHESTSNIAAILLKEAGLEAVVLDKTSKKSKHRRRKEAKWPNDYVFRLDQYDAPSFDSLNCTEFVSGYLSIMEEVTPVIPANARLLAHIEYLRQLMDDCASMECSQVRMVHRLVLQEIELKRLDWDNAQARKEKKSLAVQRVGRLGDAAYVSWAEESLSIVAQPCQPYQ